MLNQLVHGVELPLPNAQPTVGKILHVEMFDFVWCFHRDGVIAGLLICACAKGTCVVRVVCAVRGVCAGRGVRVVCIGVRGVCVGRGVKDVCVGVRGAGVMGVCVGRGVWRFQSVNVTFPFTLYIQYYNYKQGVTMHNCTLYKNKTLK